jgi:hypothetical protein
MEQILTDIRHIIEEARQRIARSINHEKTVAYWQIGRRIVVEEQEGQERAAYGKQLIPKLAEHLTEAYGEGFSPNNLWRMKDLYLTFPILDALRQELSWTHYRVLLKISDTDKREYYIAESSKMHGQLAKWSVKSIVYSTNVC